MILLDEKVAVIFDYDLVIYNFNFAFNKRAHILFLCIKKKEEPLCSYFLKNDVQIFSLTLILNHLEKVIEAL